MTKGRGKWYADFFDQAWYRIARHQVTAQRTEAEVRFIVQALDLPAPARLLDLGCGYGRVAVPLAAAGYSVTGLDLAPSLLRLARQAAREAGVHVRWLRRDMRDIPFQGYFQAVLCWGVFGVLESDEEDLKVLLAVRRALEAGGKLLLEGTNREWRIRYFQPSTRLELPDGTVSLTTSEIDLREVCLREHEVIVDTDSSKREYATRTSMYSLKELTDMLRRAGLALSRVWGDYGGQEYGLDSPRMIVLAEKGAQ